MYSLYIANKNYSSWSLRPWVLMQELGIPFQEHLIPFNPGSNWQSFRRFSPNGKVPCLVDEGLAVWDSLAILEYLAERHEGVWPSDSAARAWARCASAEMHSGFAVLRDRCSMNCGLRVRLHDIPDSLQRDVDRISELWADGLERFSGPFLAGPRFSAVDAFFTPVAFRLQTYGLKTSAVAADYASRLLALPSMRKWYSAALMEPWREQDHEEEVRRTGVVLEDLRQT